jgi:hypothetical protein
MAGLDLRGGRWPLDVVFVREHIVFRSGSSC